MTLTVKRLGACWWIIGDEDAGPMGPYDDKEEAEQDRVGMGRFRRYCDEPGYITIEREEER